ncbi:MAG: hypothetical protein H6679_03855 [Epsilonproteobacteria bacterium]|nr:hypothetical protein [Campylobacterota bacterium]
MKKRYTLLAFLLHAGLCSQIVLPAINFGSRTSSLKINDDSQLDVTSAGMQINGGRLARTAFGAITGNLVTFNRGVFASFNSEALLNGIFAPPLEVIPVEGIEDTENTGFVALGLNPDPDALDLLIANPGGFRHQLLVRPGGSLLRGQPLFFGPNDITIQDETSLLAVAAQNAINTDISMNNGVLFLQDDLDLGDDAVLLGDGLVALNNRRLALGGGAATWNGQITWDSSLDIQLNSRVNLAGSWFFFGDSQINGNGNVIDIANGGVIAVFPGSRLRISGTVIKGLGSGSILLGTGAELRLSEVEIEMDADYLFNTGGIFIDGNTNIITKDKFLTFDEEGSVTVDRVALTYDPLDFIDQFNIRPLRIEDPNHKFIEILDGGSIRKVRAESISFLDYSSDTALERYGVATPNKKIKIFPEINRTTNALNFDVTIKGNTNFWLFTRSNESLLEISDGVRAKTENIVLREFSPRHLLLGEGSTFVLGDKTTVEFARNEDLSITWTFEGLTFFKGRGSILTLQEGGKILLQGPNSELHLENMTIKGIQGTNICCTDTSSKIVLRNVRWIQSGDFTYERGSMDIDGETFMPCPGDFNFMSNGIFTILPDATFYLTRGVVFNYAPPNQNRDNFQLVDRSSAIFMDDMTLSAPFGVILTNGRLIVRNRNFLQNDGATNFDQVIQFGNGTFENNLLLDKPASATLEVISGALSDQNVFG